MITNQKGRTQTCFRRIGIGRALGETLYIRDPDGLDGSINSESVKTLVSTLTGRFLLNHAPGHSVEEVKGYDDYLAGPVATISEETHKSATILGYDIVLVSALLAIHLERSLPERNILSRFACNLTEYRDPIDVNDHERMAYQSIIEGRENTREGLPKNVHWIVDRYDEVASCFPLLFEGETQLMFAHWFFKKVHIDELTSTSELGKRMLLSALNSGWSVS